LQFFGFEIPLIVSSRSKSFFPARWRNDESALDHCQCLWLAFNCKPVATLLCIFGRASIFKERIGGIDQTCVPLCYNAGEVTQHEASKLGMNLVFFLFTYFLLARS